MSITAESVCGEHGATTTFSCKFTFDPEREAWVMTSETITPCEPEDPEEARTRTQLEVLLGAGKTVRDFARFRTERNEPAMLVLYLTAAEEGYSACFYDDDPAGGPYMGCDYEGVTWLEGAYFAALVVDGKIINSVSLSPEGWPFHRYGPPPRARRSQSPDSVQGPEIRQLPLTGYHGLNHGLWGQGKDCTTDDPCFGQIERTKLVHLADYNCDGHAWEFRLVQYAASGHEDTTLVGYSARRRKVIVYPIIANGERQESYDNFFPSPDHPGAQLVHYHSGPGHGSDTRVDREFIYDPAEEAWRMTWEQFVDYGNGPAWNPPGPYGAECALASGLESARSNDPVRTPPSQAAQAALQDVFKDPDGHTLAVVLDCTQAACRQCLIDANSGTAISSAYDLQVIGRLIDQDGKAIAGKSVRLLLPNGWKIRTRTSDTGDFNLIVGSNLERKDDKPIVLNLGVRTMGSAAPEYVLYMMPENYKDCG